MMTRLSPNQSWRIALLLSFCALSCSVRAQLIACNSTTGNSAYKIFVDDVKSSSNTPASPALARKMGGLRDFIVENLRTMSKGRASVMPCLGRFPGDASAFTDDEFGSLDNLRVLLEVWGAVEDSAGGRGALGFVLVPARQLAPPAVFVFRRASADFLSQAKQGAKLEVFTPIALGILDYQNLKYEDAIPNLCVGVNKLADVANSADANSDQQTIADQNKLLTELRRIVNDAITKARSDPNSRYQLLKAAPGNVFLCPVA